MKIVYRKAHRRNCLAVHRKHPGESIRFSGNSWNLGVEGLVLSASSTHHALRSPAI